MATTDAATGCPCCPRPTYAFRVPARYDDHVGDLGRYYRCAQYGGYVYVHELRARSPAGMAGVSY